MKFKRGASFLFAGVIKLNGSVQDMTGWTLRCHLRKVVKTSTGESIGALIATIPAAWADATIGSVTLGDNSDTSSWPLTDAAIDIEATSPGGTKTITDTTKIEIVERITQ